MYWAVFHESYCHKANFHRPAWEVQYTGVLKIQGETELRESETCDQEHRAVATHTTIYVFFCEDRKVSVWGDKVTIFNVRSHYWYSLMFLFLLTQYYYCLLYICTIVRNMQFELTPRWRGKRSRHSRRMRNPQSYVSGKRPMGTFSHIDVSVLEIILWMRPANESLSLAGRIHKMIPARCYCVVFEISQACPKAKVCYIALSITIIHWDRNKMAATLQTTRSNAFSRMEMYKLRLRFRWHLFLSIQVTIFQHWFRPGDKPLS